VQENETFVLLCKLVWMKGLIQQYRDGLVTLWLPNSRDKSKRALNIYYFNSQV